MSHVCQIVYLSFSLLIAGVSSIPAGAHESPVRSVSLPLRLTLWFFIATLLPESLFRFGK